MVPPPAVILALEKLITERDPEAVKDIIAFATGLSPTLVIYKEEIEPAYIPRFRVYKKRGGVLEIFRFGGSEGVGHYVLLWNPRTFSFHCFAKVVLRITRSVKIFSKSFGICRNTLLPLLGTTARKHIGYTFFIESR